VDVVDLEKRKFLFSIPKLTGVAGVWVAPEQRLLFTSNRGEDTASIFDLDTMQESFRVPTGSRPNGMAFDPGRRTLLIAGVGNPKVADAPPTLTFVDTISGRTIGRLQAPGRTRWATYHASSNSFFVNIADPPAIAVVAGGEFGRVDRLIPIPARGPHGLEQDPTGTLLYCACDEGVLLTVEVSSGRTERVGVVSGAPDVLWLNPRKGRLFCAVGDPGRIHVFDVAPCRPLEVVSTALGAGTLTVDPLRGEIHSFLPESHEDLVFRDV